MQSIGTARGAYSPCPPGKRWQFAWIENDGDDGHADVPNQPGAGANSGSRVTRIRLPPGRRFFCALSWKDTTRIWSRIICSGRNGRNIADVLLMTIQQPAQVGHAPIRVCARSRIPLTPKQCAVAGISCIRPHAFFGDRARTLKRDSTSIRASTRSASMP